MAEEKQSEALGQHHTDAHQEMEERRSSEAIRQQIRDTKTRIEQLTSELTLIDRSMDEHARAPAVDHRSVAALQKRRTAAAGEIEFLERRSAALEDAHQQVQAMEAAARLAEIEHEHAELLAHTESLTTHIAEASAAIVQALAELKPLIRQASQLEHEREFLALKYRLHSSPLPRLPEPARDFLRAVERAREDLGRFGADEWERKSAALRAEQQAATRAAEGERPVRITVRAGEGRDYTEALAERDEAKRAELRASLARGPDRVVTQPKRRHE